MDRIQNCIKLKDRFTTVCRTRHLSLSTERTYWNWVRKFVKDSKSKTEADLLSGAERKAGEYLASLALRGAAASTHAQALNAVVFLYRDVLRKPLGQIPELKRPTRPARLPSVPSTHEDAMRLIQQVPGRMGLLMRLIYGAALRIHDGLRLRLQDLDFANEEILIRASKGDKDRVVPMPRALREELKTLCAQREMEHHADKKAGRDWVWLPGLYGRKNPKAHFESCWQYLFASDAFSRDPQSDNTGRHHLTPEAVQNALRKARGDLSISQRFTPHSLRHASAREMQRKGVPLISIQAVLGHTNCETTLRYLGAGTKIPKAVSPLD